VIASVDTRDQATRSELEALFEGAPAFLARLTEVGPFATWDELFARAEAIAATMPEDERIQLVDAHPRLGAPPASVSAFSFGEQGYDRDTDEAIEELGRLNEAYEARFGFRYCVFVAGRSRRELIPEMKGRLGADRDQELGRAVSDAIRIARDRHARLGSSGGAER
jgi:2-oxo-4-hydroxy-4-carboxy-5-ureidoimidazoline decarboxylase